jgi:hypothetical protein
MTFTDAAVEVLRLEGRPLHYKTITDIAIEKNLLSHVGKSPEVTMGARLAATLKKDSPENPLVRVKPGVFALREWDDKTIKAGLEGKKSGRRQSVKPEAASRAEAEAPEAAEAGPLEELEAEPEAAEEGEEPVSDEGDELLVAAGETADAEEGDDLVVTPRAAQATRSGAVFDEEEEGEAGGPEEAMRAEAVAGAGDLFGEEDDDDQPILGGPDERAPAGGGGAAAGEGEGRRRRRRRRRGRGGNAEAAPVAGGGGGLPTYTATPAFEGRRGEAGREGPPREGRERGEPREPREPREVAGAEAAYRGPQVIDLAGSEGTALDDLAGRDLADAVNVILTTFDRNGGPVSLRQIAETAQRRGRLAGDVQLVQSQIAASVRADNARRIAAGQRPRFRFAGGRVGLTDWVLTSDLARLEQEALAAVERYREAARRAFVRKLADLPGHAFVELVILALERVGVTQVRAVRRAGAPGGETHFSAELRAGGGEPIKLGIVIRRDGREIGRERVTELRGSLHHYGPATVGWLFTAGQTLSGAREEASVPGTAPIALYDGAAIARLCEDHDVAVLRARMPIAIPDVDLLEALRAS